MGAWARALGPAPYIYIYIACLFGFILLCFYYAFCFVCIVLSTFAYDIEYIFNRNMPKDIIADLEALRRAGAMLPNEEIIKRGLSVDEKKAQELAESASQELSDLMPAGGE